MSHGHRCLARFVLSAALAYGLLHPGAGSEPSSAANESTAKPVAGSSASQTKAGEKRAAEKKAGEKPTVGKVDGSPAFIRVVRDTRSAPLKLETATVGYASTDPKKPFTVDLIGCIHIGDKDYFESLRERFKQYDAVLFELVMPDGRSLRDVGRGRSNHPVAMVQQSLPKMLDLAYQLENIDYTAKNFVHADLSPDKMAQAMKARGDTGASVVFKVLFDVLKEANRQSAARAQKGGDLSELQLLAALFDSNRPLALKRLMADQMESIGAGGGALGPTLDAILIQDRNAAAMKVLATQIQKGTRKIAVFYGAAHMPDFDRRLTTELHLKRGQTNWDTAWDLRGK